jgi:hypothetical protein
MMKTIRRLLPRRICTAAGITGVILAAIVTEPGFSAIYYNGSGQFAIGKYIFDSNTSSYTLYNGLGFSSGIFNFSFSLPMIYQSTPWISLSGTNLIPSGGTQHGEVRQRTEMHGSTVLIDTSQYHHTGIGDPVFHGEARIIEESTTVPATSLTADAKPPLANPSNGFGTGEWNWSLGVSLAKKLGPVFGFVTLGYWMLGDMPDLELKDPFVYSLSLGKPLAQGKYSVLASYSGQTQVLETAEPPSMISLMVGRFFNTSSSLSLSTSFGLSNSAPDIAIGLGWHIGLSSSQKSTLDP